MTRLLRSMISKLRVPAVIALIAALLAALFFVKLPTPSWHLIDDVRVLESNGEIVCLVFESVSRAWRTPARMFRGFVVGGFGDPEGIETRHTLQVVTVNANYPPSVQRLTTSSRHTHFSGVDPDGRPVLGDGGTFFNVGIDGKLTETTFRQGPLPTEEELAAAGWRYLGFGSSLFDRDPGIAYESNKGGKDVKLTLVERGASPSGKRSVTLRVDGAVVLSVDE